ncbi:hypothetical protein [Aliikangiella coralliicola]|uniref:Uncharacterized protein n=1 Tax=Aliikangiella coralliicola TaxID=2592383 RepID=A0A545UFS1_9GAMM|nr:hypothetical protein [Aliikangiella coralliicola]TQV88321.1 hypothetical protein FLL46_07290 [Aliikangiella coralliicola]
MELDDLKKAIEKEKQTMKIKNPLSFSELKTKVSKFERSIKRNFLIETLVAVFAFIMVIVAMVSGPYIYPLIVKELLPELASNFEPKLNFMMYLGLFLMAIYCLFVPLKLYFAIKVDDSLSWTLTSRVDKEIEKLEKQNRLWSSANTWSLAPAAIIGVLFFWGLQYSLSGSWYPNIYLSLYFVFVVVSLFLGVWLKNNLVEEKIRPLLEKLYAIKEEINTDYTLNKS